MHRVTILTGGFGSGKSEIAINLALYLAASNETALVDLDIANPYFRSREARHFLAEQGIKAVVPREEWLDADLPILSPGVRSLLLDPAWTVVLDVGGDEIGAIALGGLQAVFQSIEHQMLMVVNPFRPFTRDVAGIEFMCREIERASRLKMRGIISNPNLGQPTLLEHVLSGHQIVVQAAQKLDLPIVCLGVLAEKLEKWTARREPVAGDPPGTQPGDGSEPGADGVSWLIALLGQAGVGAVGPGALTDRSSAPVDEPEPGDRTRARQTPGGNRRADKPDALAVNNPTPGSDKRTEGRETMAIDRLRLGADQSAARPDTGVPLLPLRIHLSPDWLLKQQKIDSTVKT